MQYRGRNGSCSLRVEYDFGGLMQHEPCWVTGKVSREAHPKGCMFLGLASKGDGNHPETG